MGSENLKQALVNLALAEVGTREEGGNNKGKRVETYMQATWLAVGPWPWCAAFTCWLLREWLKLPEVREYLNLDYNQMHRWRCRDASAFGWVKWANKQGLHVTDEKELARAGDFVVFDFSHIGIVTHNQQPGETTIRTVEGNTNWRGDRDSPAGDGVWQKERPVNIVNAYIRIIP